jgi:hypothetical protein
VIGFQNRLSDSFVLLLLSNIGYESCVPTDCGAKLQHFEMVLEVCGGLSWKCRFNVVYFKLRIKN